MRLTLTMIAAMATACVIHVDPDYDTGPAQIDNHYAIVDGPITQVVVDVDVGAIYLDGSYRTDAVVDADLHYDWDREPRLDVYAVDTTLYITLDCPATAGECRGDIYAQIPFDAFLDTTLDVGDLTVVNVMGDWIGSIGAGNVHGSQLTSFWVDVLADTGSIDLSFDLEPDYVSSYVRVGDVNLTVPSGVYDITTVVHSGSVWMSGVTVDPFAARELNATASTGNIVINGF